MSSAHTPGVGAPEAGSSAEASAAPPSPAEAASVRRAAFVGNSVVVVLAVALVAEAAGWLLLGAGPLRDTLAWGGTGAVAASLLAMVLVRAASPVKTRTRSYQVAWAMGLPGTRWRRWRVALFAVATTSFLVVVVALAWLTQGLTGNGQKISAAGSEVIEAPVIAIDNKAKAGPGRTDGVKADYTVRLPGAQGADAGRKFTVHVLSPKHVKKGETLAVAYAPSKPGLGAVADEDRDEVERKLAGLGISARAWLFTVIGWVAGTMAITVLLLKERGLLPGRRFTGATARSAASVRVAGFVEYRQAPTKKGGTPQTVKAMRMACGGLEVPFAPLSGDAEVAARALDGQTGWLEWDPAQQSGRSASADFVVPDGRRLQGSVPDGKLEPVGPSAGHPHHAGPSQEGEKAVDIGAAYPLALLPSAAAILGLAVALHVPLIALTGSGQWRPFLAVGSLFTIGITAVYNGMKNKS